MSIGFGVTINNEMKAVWGFSASLEIGMTTESSDLLEFSIQASETIRTSEAISLAGKQGDVLMGFAMMVQTGIANELKVVSDQAATCRFAIQPQLATSALSDAEDTLYLYSHRFIESTQIPLLTQAIELTDDEKDKAQLQKDLAQWKTILDFKEQQSKLAGSLYSGQNSQVYQAFTDLKEKGRKFFASVNSYSFFHRLNHPAGIEVAALAQLAVAFVASVNVLGLISALSIYAVTTAITIDTFSNTSPEILQGQLLTLKSLFDQAASDFQSRFFLKDSSKRISFDGGSSGYDQSYTVSKNQGLSITRSKIRKNKMGLPEASFEGSLFGFASESETTAHLSTESLWAERASHDNSTETTISIHLADPNPSDSFIVDIFEDPFYGVPTFVLQEASRTSCPNELGSSPSEVPRLHLLSPSHLENVHPKEAGVFKLSVSNNSPVSLPLI
jgi:hypothetical protein